MTTLTLLISPTEVELEESKANSLPIIDMKKIDNRKVIEIMKIPDTKEMLKQSLNTLLDIFRRVESDDPSGVNSASLFKAMLLLNKDKIAFPKRYKGLCVIGGKRRPVATEKCRFSFTPSES